MRGEGSGRSLRHWPCPAQGSSPREGREAWQHLPLDREALGAAAGARPAEAHLAQEAPARPRPGPALQGAGITAQSCGLASALWPEALGARVCLARSPWERKRGRPGLAGPSTPQEGWTQESTCSTPGNQGRLRDTPASQAPPGPHSTSLSWGTLPEPPAQEPCCPQPHPGWQALCPVQRRQSRRAQVDTVSCPA